MAPAPPGTRDTSAMAAELNARTRTPRSIVIMRTTDMSVTSFANPMAAAAVATCGRHGVRRRPPQRGSPRPHGHVRVPKK